MVPGAQDNNFLTETLLLFVCIVIFSCDQASVGPFVTPFSLCSCHCIIMKFSESCPCKSYLLNLTESSFSQTTKANLLGPPFQPAKICLWQDHPGNAGQGGRGGQTKQ